MFSAKKKCFVQLQESRKSFQFCFNLSLSLPMISSVPLNFQHFCLSLLVTVEVRDARRLLFHSVSIVERIIYHPTQIISFAFMPSNFLLRQWTPLNFVYEFHAAAEGSVLSSD